MLNTFLLCGISLGKTPWYLIFLRVLNAHIRQILFFGPGLYPRFPSALVLVLLIRFTQDRHSLLWWCCIDVPKALELWRNGVPLKGNFIVIFVFKMQCQVYLLPGVDFVLYIKDHNGNKFYFKLYCVILDELSVFTTFLSKKRKKERKKERYVA